MSNIKECANCIWADKCTEREVCDSYVSIFADEQELIDEATYLDDLNMRHYTYQEQVEEQNS